MSTKVLDESMYSSFILISQELETAQVSTSGRTNNLAVMQVNTS